MAAGEEGDQEQIDGPGLADHALADLSSQAFGEVGDVN
jgi:hypothetical protein